MTVPFWCLFISAMMPIVWAWVGGYFRHQQFGRVDNKQPRAQYAQLQGAGARALAAQQNAWEALAVFTAAVCVAHLAGADPEQAAIAAQVFVVARVLHGVFYIADKDALRSIVFIIGLGCSLWLFVMAA
ncbi:MAPEG family protein [Oceanicoccus sp. KOV_DT_Chl]|uniref:MAPEG family protein n=1 Tax=Oceanicoccus sp. KOV_DT_Chl TaxID=1904639 RepID=UPI000C7C4962|nr:MAPEG family protein [Oceanicoccus sp. KOV_DT_Chl]